MLQKIKETIRRYQMLNCGDTIIVAVSGGPDSIALLSILDRLAPAFSLQLVVAHLNHALRPEADGETVFVKAMAEKYGWPYASAQVDVAALSRQRKISLEDAGRTARYDFLRQVAKQYGAAKIALGHHGDDQAETVMMNLIRGSGPEGMKGMLPVRKGFYIRPLLFVCCADILDYLQKEGLTFASDRSNESDDFLRNRIRHRLLPLLREEFNPKIDAGLGRLAEIVSRENAFMEGLVERTMDQWGLANAGDQISLSVLNLLDLHEALQNRIIKKLLERFCPEEKGISFNHILAVTYLLQSGQPSGCLVLPYGIHIRRDYDRLSITKQGRGTHGYARHDFLYNISVPGEATVIETGDRVRLTLMTGPCVQAAEWKKDPTVAWMDYDQIRLPLVIRNVRPGDKMHCLGMEGTKKIKDIFIDDKISRGERGRLPLLVDARAVLWIGGGRSSHDVRITDQTKRILKAEII